LEREMIEGEGLWIDVGDWSMLIPMEELLRANHPGSS